MNKETKTFSENLQDIEAIVEKLESDDISLEDTIKLYKEGMKVLKDCSSKIDAIEKELLIIENDSEEYKE